MTSENTTSTMASDSQDTARPNRSWKRSILSASSRIMEPPSNVRRPTSRGRPSWLAPERTRSVTQRAVVCAFDLRPLGGGREELVVRGRHFLGERALVRLLLH